MHTVGVQWTPARCSHLPILCFDCYDYTPEMVLSDLHAYRLCCGDCAKGLDDNVNLRSSLPHCTAVVLIRRRHRHSSNQANFSTPTGMDSSGSCFVPNNLPGTIWVAGTECLEITEEVRDKNKSRPEQQCEYSMFLILYRSGTALLTFLVLGVACFSAQGISSARWQEASAPQHSSRRREHGHWAEVGGR